MLPVPVNGPSLCDHPQVSEHHTVSGETWEICEHPQSLNVSGLPM